MENKFSGFCGLSEWNKPNDFDNSIELTEFLENSRLYLDTIKDRFKRKETISNERFDQIFDNEMRRVSSVHWTPVDVSLSILELLDLDEESRVLDVGSGAGKFCLIGALNSKARFTGIEQRQYLVKFANKLVRDFRVNNASFIFGNAIKLDWSCFDVIYLFNPYHENIMAAGLRIDLEIKVSHKKYRKLILATLNKLSQLKAGTKVITYYGFGEGLPENFKLISSVEAEASQIDLWVKTK